MQKNLHLSRLVVLASHTGTNFDSIARSCKNSDLPAKLLALITNNPLAKVIDKAKKKNIPFHSLSPTDFLQEDPLIQVLDIYKPDLLILAGFVKKLGPKVLKKYKAINTHPSLLPKYGGKGMYGLRVHRAVIKAKDPLTGVSVHEVNEDYDKGKILAQIKIPVLDSDTAESLRDRLKPIENKFYIETLQKILTQNL